MSEQYRPTGFSFLPPVVKNLLIINGLFYLGMITLKQVYQVDLSDYLGLHYFGSDLFRPYQFLTYMFMHSFQFDHILFNMFALWMFGSAVENTWGGKRFLIYYLITGVGASIMHYGIMYFEMKPTLDAINMMMENLNVEEVKSFVVNDHFITSESKEAVLRGLSSVNPSEGMQAAASFLSEYKTLFLNAPNVVGASGAVFGLLLAFGMLFPNSMIYIYFFIPMKAKYFVLLYGALELFFGVTGSQSNVAHFAHLGGMIFGFILIMYWRKTNSFGRF